MAPDYLLVDENEIAAARKKATKYAWAREALDRVLADAESALARPVSLPDRGGQWPHWYSCKLDGAPLQTVSPAEHRCPVCGTVYRGEPYDSVVLYHVHSRYSREVRDLGLAWRFAGRAEYARRAREILLAYARRYREYPRHDINGQDTVRGGRVMAQTLDESVWLIPMAWGYTLVKDQISGPDRTSIERDLLVTAAEVIREHRMGIHNIQCWKNSAVALAGFAAGNRDLAGDAIENPDRGFHAQIARGVTDDGLWYEGSLGYHRYTMDAIWPLTEAARHAGIDLYSDRLRTLYDAPLALSFPDGDPPGFNDNRGSNISTYGPLYEIAFSRWGTPAYGRLVAGTKRDSLQALLYGKTDPPSGPMIPTESTLLRSAGYAMLRSPGTAVAIRYGMHGGGHGHPDKLGVVTWGAGRLWGLDPGSINYGVPLHQEWYRSTIAHNTVTVDGVTQKPADGELVEWKSERGVTSIVARARSVYPGVTLTRAIVLRNGVIEDNFDCESDTEHLYDWTFHAAGEISSSLQFDKPGDLNSSAGYQHIRDVLKTTTGEDWWIVWRKGSVKLALRVRRTEATEVYLGTAPGREPAERIPVVIVRRRGKATRFSVSHHFEPAA